MNLLDNVINDDNLTGTMKSVYKYINKHSEQIDEILDLTYRDLSILFNNVEKTDSSISIITDETTQMSSIDIATDTLIKHFNDILNDANFTITYIYRVYCIGTTIYIAKKI